MAANDKAVLLKFMERTSKGYRLKKKFHSTEEINVPIVAESMLVHEMYGVKAYPLTVIIDRNGILISAEPYLMSYAPGAITNYDNLNSKIQILLK